jgi:hypothetical protein
LVCSAGLAKSKHPVTWIQFEGTLDMTDPATGKVRHLRVHPTDGGALRIDPSSPGSADSGRVTFNIQSLGGAHVELTPAPASR